MRLTVARLYGGSNFASSLKIDEPAECVVEQMFFDISADGITKVKEVDEVIRQLQLLKSEIAGGCTKPVIRPIEVLGRTE